MAISETKWKDTLLMPELRVFNLTLVVFGYICCDLNDIFWMQIMFAMCAH